MKFELSGNLLITSRKGDFDYKHYLDNAYNDYKAEPDSIKNVISRYVASASDLYVERSKLNTGNIVPVIKPAEYLNDVSNLGDNGKAFPMLTDKYNDQLIIAYAEDTKNNIRYLNEDDFKKLGISRDSLKSIALRNFDRIIPNIQRQGENGLYMVTAGGDYEASLILLPSIWNKENFPVDGDFIVGIHNRDLLLITGSNNPNGIGKIKEVIANSYKTGNYQVSESLYRWTGSKFEKLQQ